MKSEFEFIEKIRCHALSSSVKIGIGDDCAVIPKDSKTDLVITTDLLVEDIDFRLDWAIPDFLGHKALAVSLSDIAAMGAKPVWAMLSIGIPQKIWKTNFVGKFYEGWFALAKKFGVELIGGDVSKTPDKIVVDSIVAGEVEKNKAILRSTAMPGDLIFVSGKLGGAAGALVLLENGKRFNKTSKNQIQNLLLRQLKPNPQIEIGQILSKKNLATAMIDLSDGLSSDLAHLCRESKVGAKLFADKIPVDENLKVFSTQRRKDAEKTNSNLLPIHSIPHSCVLNGGEDFELLFTVNPKKNFQLEKLLKNLPVSCIGKITSTAGKIELISNSETKILKPEGFRHF
jgi:thiamine-monophosphate kinase